ncbi:hypothetical protein P3W85_43280 [Cupriavidus basilensis]|uniref:PNPLA domain-containing protein n=1 Tax=Cupriavidus basilensis TaxID=68895 RepID=A0ABT6B4A8_9BURK|nr:hypothetical protein [Cupriavidus basilensis]MDF3839714.1 hypothetical protein [Cupriavidus basilensis]
MPVEDQASGDELARIARRRRQLGIARRLRDGDSHWALALSGGGIRSATFCLGVMQALAKAPPPPVADPAGPVLHAVTPDAAPDGPPDNVQVRLQDAVQEGDGPNAPTAAPPPATTALLGQFDYLSTVSGGGYLGAFFCSLFVPGRLKPGTAPAEAAALAYRTLQQEPPGRIRSSTSYVADPGRAAVAWLRENGRYLTPTGAGDALYAGALVVRNWFAMQYVIGSALLLLLAVLALLRHLAVGNWLDLGRHEMDLLHDARQVFNEGGLAIWWSELLWLPLAALLLFAVPPGVAYWLVYPHAGEARPALRFDSAATRLAALAGVAMLGLAAWLNRLTPGLVLPRLLLAAAVLTLLGVACCFALCREQPATVQAYRVRATRALRNGVGAALWFAALGAADTVGRTFYLYTQNTGHPWGTLGPAAMAGGLVWLVRYGAGLVDGKGGAGGGNPWLSRLPVSLLAGIGAALVALLVFMLWSWLVLWVRWNGGQPLDWMVFGNAYTTPVLCTLSVLALGLTLIAGRFAGFLNLSTLQPFYAARLTRAYLGGSNGKRFMPGSGAGPAQQHAIQRARLSVAEPEDGDSLSLNAYYDPAMLAPLHLINVTLNLTVDPAEQLVQRDRKGKPLCIAPGPFMLPHTAARAIPADAFVRFTVDGQLYYPETWKAGGSELSQSRTLGDWIATSGAAVSTGLGRSTTLGTSLLLGLANLRLGTWWPSYPLDAGSAPRRGGAERDRVQAECAGAPWLGGFITLFRTQYYLACELSARFHGTRRGWQYLSDGGHFENTAVYELLRPERRVALIVLCDCGADPRYQFGDLANLIRLARIDLGLEIVVDTAAAGDAVLGSVFGTPASFSPQGRRTPSDKCALLLNVFRADEPAGTRRPVSRIVLLKPCPIASAPADVRQYGAGHPAFPQEPTSDQFFDEAQWESYRALGLAIGQRVFGGGADGDAVARALWAR